MSHFDEMPVVHLTVLGTPAPQGSKTFVGMSKTGRGILRESSAKVKPWRADVVEAALARYSPEPGDAMNAAGGFPLDGPLAVSMVFTLRKPSSAPKRRQTWPCRTPDLSKLIRSTEDALTTVGIWRDDARVVEYVRAAKVFPGEDPDALTVPGAVIRIWTIAPSPESPAGLAATASRGPDRAGKESA